MSVWSRKKNARTRLQVSLCVAYRNPTFAEAGLYMIKNADFIFRVHCTHSHSLHFVSFYFFNALSFWVDKKSTENLLKYHVNTKCILLKVRFFFFICFGYVCRCLSKTSIYRRSAVNDTKSSIVCIEWFVVCPGTSFTLIFLLLSDIWNPNISRKQFITWIIIID